MNDRTARLYDLVLAAHARREGWATGPFGIGRDEAAPRIEELWVDLSALDKDELVFQPHEIHVRFPATELVTLPGSEFLGRLFAIQGVVSAWEAKHGIDQGDHGVMSSREVAAYYAEITGSENANLYQQYRNATHGRMSRATKPLELALGRLEFLVLRYGPSGQAKDRHPGSDEGDCVDANDAVFCLNVSPSRIRVTLDGRKCALPANPFHERSSYRDMGSALRRAECGRSDKCDAQLLDELRVYVESRPTPAIARSLGSTGDRAGRDGPRVQRSGAPVPSRLEVLDPHTRSLLGSGEQYARVGWFDGAALLFALAFNEAAMRGQIAPSLFALKALGGVLRRISTSSGKPLEPANRLLRIALAESRMDGGVSWIHTSACEETARVLMSRGLYEEAAALLQISADILLKNGDENYLGEMAALSWALETVGSTGYEEPLECVRSALRDQRLDAEIGAHVHHRDAIHMLRFSESGWEGELRCSSEIYEPHHPFWRGLLEHTLGVGLLSKGTRESINSAAAHLEAARILLQGEPPDIYCVRSGELASARPSALDQVRSEQSRAIARNCDVVEAAIAQVNGLAEEAWRGWDAWDWPKTEVFIRTALHECQSHDPWTKLPWSAVTRRNIAEVLLEEAGLCSLARRTLLHSSLLVREKAGVQAVTSHVANLIEPERRDESPHGRVTEMFEHYATFLGQFGQRGDPRRP